jgi:hypothetical protein
LPSRTKGSDAEPPPAPKHLLSPAKEGITVPHPKHVHAGRIVMSCNLENCAAACDKNKQHRELEETHGVLVVELAFEMVRSSFMILFSISLLEQPVKVY